MNAVDWTIVPRVPGDVLRTFAEMRKRERTLTLKTGKLRSDAMGWTSCAIVNVSEGGACVLIPDATDVPDKVILEFDDGSQHDCEVRWRSTNSAGVRFV